MENRFTSLGEAAAAIVEDLRFRLLCQALHSHGPRVLAEFLAELGAERSITFLIENKIARYIDADFQGGPDFPSAPIHLVWENPS